MAQCPAIMHWNLSGMSYSGQGDSLRPVSENSFTLFVKKKDFININDNKN